METLITILVLVLLSAVSSWLKKRAESGESETETWTPPRTPDRTNVPPRRTPPTPRGTSEPRPATRSWEEELRRLLEGDTSPAPPRPTPPPTPARPQPAPPILPGPRPVPVPSSSPMPPLPPPPREVPAVHVLDLKESATARLQAQRIKERAVVELKRTEAAVARDLAQTHVTRRGLTSEIVAARSWLASPRSARQAVIASVILGPPVGS